MMLKVIGAVYVLVGFGYIVGSVVTLTWQLFAIGVSSVIFGWYSFYMSNHSELKLHKCNVFDKHTRVVYHHGICHRCYSDVYGV